MCVRLTAMRYKDYTWPHNPEVYTVEHQRRIAVHKVPFGRCVMQDMGGAYRVLRGEGVFAGQGAYDQFRELLKVFQEDGAGPLIHPVWQTEQAWFVELTVTEKPLPDYVRYTFTFWEDWNGYRNGLTDRNSSTVQASGSASQTENHTIYVVKKGDTLWGIASRHGITLAALIAANPQIKNPNMIYVGDKVRLP